MEINGVPLHPLVVHAAVVFVPLAALAVIAFCVPRWRWLARWPALLLVLGAGAAVQLSEMTGENLMETRGLDSALVRTHQEWGEILKLVMLVLTAVTVLAFWALPHATRLAGGTDRTGHATVLEKPLLVVLPLLAVAVLVLVVLTGDAGARAVWKG